MRLVVDSNILFSFFWKSSVFKELSKKQELELFSPVYALEEIKKYSPEILEKAKLSGKDFNELREKLATRVEFVPLEEYSQFLKKAESLIKNLPKDECTELFDDIDFLALALKLACPIWSNDKLLKKQSMVIVFSTEQVIHLLGDYK